MMSGIPAGGESFAELRPIGIVIPAHALLLQ
jgi:hypothetical protein